MSCCSMESWPALSRREAMSGAVALGAGLSLLARPGMARAAGHAEALLLSCMDYRLMNDVEAYMDGRGLKENYDHVILAGASLGAVNTTYPAWRDVFFTHLDLAVQLHDVHRVIVVDHRDCGAYKLLLGEASVKDPATELASHVAQLYLLRTAIGEKHPHMAVELGLMGLDGKVTPIA